MPPQIDAYIPVGVLRYLGAVKTQTGRSRFYISFLQFAMIAVLFYNDSAAIQGLFPSMYAWAGFLLVFGLLLMVADYVFVFPAEITYNQGQAARENRNPTFKEVKENGRQLERLEDRLDDLE